MSRSPRLSSSAGAIKESGYEVSRERRCCFWGERKDVAERVECSDTAAVRSGRIACWWTVRKRVEGDNCFVWARIGWAWVARASGTLDYSRKLKLLYCALQSTVQTITRVLGFAFHGLG